jgi:hypothetical protein
VVALSIAFGLLVPVGLAHSHELVVDRVELRPWSAEDMLVGQLIVDPELSRGPDEPVTEGVRRHLIETLLGNLEVLCDGHRTSLSLQVREFWTRGGAVPGDLVALRARLPSSPQRVEVVLGDALSWVVLTIDAAPAGEPAELSSVLLRGGERSPPFTRSTTRGVEAGQNPPRSTWISGGGQQLEQQVAARQRASNERSTRSSRSSRRTWLEVWRFFELGVTHIVPLGWDHLAFISGLVLGAVLRRERGRWRRLVWLLTAFTLAHTLTLALGALGWVVPSPRIVEPIIGLSVFVIALENLWWSHQRRVRLLVVFVFGLVHGLAFSSVLSSFGLGQGRFLPALLAFNVGVEVGQLLVVSLWLVAFQVLAKQHHARFARAGSWVIAGLGAYWAISRLF